MHAIALRWRDKFANFFEPDGVEPPLPAAALDSKAICGLLIGPAELMTALVGEDHIFTGVDTLLISFGLRMRNPG